MVVMLLAGIFSVWVLTTTTAGAGADINGALPISQTSELSRLDRLENLLANHQAQWETEKQALRDQWQKEREIRQHERSQWEWEKEAFQREIDQLKKQTNTKNAQEHMQSARSDDGGPLEVTVNHLAQTTTQLQADVQALRTQHSTEMQALRTQYSTDLHALQAADAQQLQAIQAARDAEGSDFVHWGSSMCSGTSELMYSGIISGSYFTNTGGAANALCLSLSPVMADKTTSVMALLYNAELETKDTHDDMDPLCAVCRSPHSATVMVPGTNVCSQGWTLQYSGYIMAGLYSQAAASEYICMDSKMEGMLGSNGDHDGYTLYYTKARCGGLPCPPFQNDKVVTCAVCSK